MSRVAEVQLKALPGIGAIEAGHSVSDHILTAIERDQTKIRDGDVFVIAQKAISKAEARLIDLTTVTPSPRAQKVATEVGQDPRKVELILAESQQIVRLRKAAHGRPGLLICRHRLGPICANAGIDESNLGTTSECVLLLPQDPDQSAKQIRRALQRALQCRLGVIISDTHGRPWRRGQVNIALGLAGVPSRVQLKGDRDGFGRTLCASEPAFADEIAAAAGLVMAKAALTPVVHCQGLTWPDPHQCATDAADACLRPTEEDLFQ